MNCHLIPNWSESVTETYEFRTTVFTTYSGREQRIAERLTPRRTVSFSSLLWDSRLADFKALMHDRGAASITIPDPARYSAVLASDAVIGATTVIVSGAPWLAEDIALSLSDLDATTFVGGETIVGVGAFSEDFDESDFDTGLHRFAVSLSGPLERSWPKGTVVRPVVTGRLAKSITLNHATDRVASVSIALAVNPPSTTPIMRSAALGTFDGRPVLLAEPNWTQAPTVTFSTPFEEVDYERGVVQTFLPVEFYTKITQFAYSDRSRESIGEVLTLFNAMRGRQGEFYSPSWTTDLYPSGGIASGTDELTVLGSNIAETYATSTVEKAVAIKLADGTWLLRKVTSIVATSDPGPGAFSADYDESYDPGGAGTFSKLEFATSVGVDIPQRNIIMICWLNVCRFATDSLTIRWMTDDIGQAAVQIMSLEALASEP